MRVLVAAADASSRAAVTTILGRHGFEVSEAETLPRAEHELRHKAPDIAIVDDSLLPDEAALRTLRDLDERIPLIVLGGGFSHELAEHQVSKPFEATALIAVLHRATDVQRSRRRSMAISVAEHRRGLDPFVGTSVVIRTLSDQAHRLLDSHAPILLQGETGTGKGVLASWLHHHGPRAEEAFVDINCAGLSHEFVESELFGYGRGAFTGAIAPKLGLLDVAHRGTAFLDEIGEIDLQLQPRLLKVLEEKRFRRLGDVRDRVVDIRLIAATNRDLARRARDGTFRADLYYRINTLALTVPPLRRRPEDVPPLSRQIANSLGHDIDFTPDAIAAMQAYHWPGNVRELRNVIERAILISNRLRITPGDLRFEADPVGSASTEEPECELGTLEDAERRHIERVLRYENGSVERSAQRLGVSRSTLYQKLRRYGIATQKG